MDVKPAVAASLAVALKVQLVALRAWVKLWDVVVSSRHLRLDCHWHIGRLASVTGPLLTLCLVVLAMSIWNDPKQQMAWLDSGSNGPCGAGQGSPANILSQHPDTHVVFSNIRWGDIGSTTKA